MFQTSLYPLEEVLPLYHGAKEVQAQFHRLVETDDPAGDGKDVFTAIIYGNRFDYQVFESYRIGADTRGIHGGGIYTRMVRCLPGYVTARATQGQGPSSSRRPSATSTPTIWPTVSDS